jgi:butyrate kinase
MPEERQLETLTLLVRNKAGVLEQIAGQIRREGWNIKSLNVDETGDPSLSLMHIRIEGLHAKLASVAERMLKLEAVDSAQIDRSGSPLRLAPRPAPQQPQAKPEARPAPPKPEGAMRTLVINPGSTSTKYAVYDDESLVFEENAHHSRASLDLYGSVLGQKGARMGVVRSSLGERGVPLSSIDAVAGRGGTIKPVESGTYPITDLMISDLAANPALHASSLGAVIARELADEMGVPSFVVDPIVVDEMDPLARLSGMAGVERTSVFHALNQKATARIAAERLGKPYENCRLVVAHLGGGITVGAHRYGRVIDVNDALNGEGAFTPERSGAVPLLPLVEMCFSGEYAKEEIVAMITKNGGMQAYLGTNDLKAAQKMIDAGDTFAATVVDSMAYQVSLAIGGMFAALEGRCDAIVLTGGLAHSSRFTGSIKERVDRFAPIFAIAGEHEMHALMRGALSVLKGWEAPKTYE